jgi:hypothetical protein
MEPEIFKSEQKIVLIFLFLILVFSGKAQTNLSFYPLNDQFNSSSFNPAFLNSPQKFTFSMFPLGGTSIGYDNQEVIKGLVKEYLLGITTDDDYKKVLKSITDRSSFIQNIETTLLTFTFRSRIGFFNFRIKENQNFSASLKGELTSFIFNTDIQSATINQIQNMPSQAMHYREYSIGYSLPVGEHKFTAGIRAKVYFGKGAFDSGLSGSIQNNSPNYILRAVGKVNISIPEFQKNKSGEGNNMASTSGSNAMSYLMNSGNTGLGLDLGIKYQITPELNLSMSAIDLGKINWKTNLNSKNFDGSYQISSTDVTKKVAGETEIITKNFDHASFADTISNKFDLTYDRTAFSTQVPVNVYTSLQYHLNSKVKISIVDRYVLIKNMNYNSLAFLTGIDLNKELSVSTGYSIIGNSYTNLPLSLLYKKDFGQIYLGTDNLLSFIIPSISDFAGLTFGTCFYLFRNKGQLNTTSDDYPFYKPRKIRKNQKTGLLIKEYSVY